MEAPAAHYRSSKTESYVDNKRKDDICQANIISSRAVTDAVHTSLGPKSMDKMISTASREVTNDGATILNKMEVLQPAAKMLVELSKSQDVVAGDGTTTVEKLIVPLRAVLNNATVETDNPDLRDCAYIYCRYLSTNPEAAKDAVLAEKPVISDDSNPLNSSLLDELLANIATLSSVHHKPPEAFVTRVKAAVCNKLKKKNILMGVKLGILKHLLRQLTVVHHHQVVQIMFHMPKQGNLFLPLQRLLLYLIYLVISWVLIVLLFLFTIMLNLPASTGQGLQISAQLTR